MHRFDTPVPPRLTIEVRAGAVTIDAADVAETTVDLRPRYDSVNAREVIAATTVEQRGEEIVVLVPRRRGFLGRESDIDVRITTPNGAALAIETGSADVRASGRFSSTTVSTGSGDVELGELTESARLRAGSGDILVRAVGGDLDGQSGSGDVAVDSLLGAGSLQSGSGDIKIGAGGRALQVKTGSGDVTIGTSPDDLRVITASGDIGIHSISRGAVVARAASGDIRVGVCQGTAAWLDVRSISGRVSSALDSGDEPGADEQQVRLTLETVSGDIELRRV